MHLLQIAEKIGSVAPVTLWRYATEVGLFRSEPITKEKSGAIRSKVTCVARILSFGKDCMADTDRLASDVQSTSLFGGAIELRLSQCFEDVSDFRPVPDNQEVRVLHCCCHMLLDVIGPG